MGVREIIVAAVVVLAGYLAYLLWQLVRPARPRAPLDPLREAMPEEPVAARHPAQALPEEYFRLQFELQQLRAELDERDEAVQRLRCEVQDLRDQMFALQDQLEAVHPAPAMSPQYGEAMLLARRGLDAAQIAERCAISVGEAELVCALTQREGRG